MASFRFCETYLLHIKTFVVNKSGISLESILGRRYKFVRSFTFALFLPSSISTLIDMLPNKMTNLL